MNLGLNYGVLFRDWTMVLKDAVQIKLLTGETYCSGKEITGKPSTDSGVQFILGVSGEGEISLGQDIRSFYPHNLFLIEEGQAAVVINRERTPLVCYIIHCQRVGLLQGSAPEQNQSDNQNRTGVLEVELCNSVNLQHMAMDEMKQIVEIFQREDLHDPLGCHLLFHKWMCAIVEQLRREAELQQPNLAIQKTIDYLDEHYDDPITVQQLAKMANVSRKWYTMRFREITNQNPRDYITELRIKRAKELLNLTGDSLYEIARKVGYEDEHYFSRRFKQMVGRSPRLYLHHRRYLGTTMTSPELLHTLGMTPIVAKAPFSEFPHYLKESFKQVRKWEAGNSLDMDEIRGLKPDLIIASAWQDDQHYEQLNRIATTVLLPERNNWREELKDLGEVLGRNKQVQQVINNFNERLNQARVQLHRLISDETIVYIRLTSEGINLYGEKSSRGDTLYRELDLKMPNTSLLYGEGMLISVEILAQIQPDHILLQMENSLIAQHALYDHPMWNQLLAVQNNQVHILSNREWYNFSFSPLATQYAIQEMLNLLTKKTVVIR
ncbi:AraC family transcriptional regulator [Paenibacillus sp. DCT19]|uniref:AraC family transcriptional regulator n=1 Tax=Paenibacillus sp. DCT19 TaxID=2211212 RepID=UPI000FE1CD31|nr:AraC family transcriptional regulator [Paenibacillus sp. DCT19]